MADSIERRIGEARRTAFVAAFARELSTAAAFGLFAAGTLAFVLRFALRLSPATAALALLGALLAPAFAWIRTSRRLLSRGGAATWLDLRAGGTGLLLAEIETGDAAWRRRAASLLDESPALPRLRIGRLLGRPAPALAFAAAAILVPIPRSVLGPSPAVLESAVERLRDKVRALEEEVRLEEEVADEIETRLDRLEEEADRGRPESAFEAMDRLEDRLLAEGDRAAEIASKARDSLAAAEAAAGSDVEAAQASLEAALAEMTEGGLDAKLPPSLLEDLGSESLALAEGTKLDGSRLMEVSREIRDLLDKKMESLSRSGLLRPRPQTEGRDPLERYVEHECDSDCPPGGA